MGGYNIRDLFTILYLAKKFNRKGLFFLEKPKNNIYIGLFIKRIYLKFLFKIFDCHGIFSVGRSAQIFYKKLQIKFTIYHIL